MPSATYRLFARAMKERKHILCLYDDYIREVCPIILGHSDGEEKALVFQFAGASSRPLPPAGQWRCFYLDRVEDIHLRDGPWHSGPNHRRPQTCVKVVDFDVNPTSPYIPLGGFPRRLPRPVKPRTR